MSGIVNKPEKIQRYYRRILPKIYLYIVYFGLAVTGATFSFLPSLYWCSKFFGDQECDPFGRYLIAFASLPGLPIAGGINSKWPNLHPAIFFFVLTLSSLVIYYIIGLIMDRLIKNKVTLTSVQKLILLVFIFFVLLFLILSSLN